MVFERQAQGRVKIDVQALRVFRDYRQLHPADCEAGGILLGRLVTQSDDIVIDDATPPHVSDRRSRFAFWRAKRPAQDRVDSAWAQSAGTSLYLGEWHTHPEALPQPSGKDLQEWQKILQKTKRAPDMLYFVIVGVSAVVLWEGDRHLRTLTQLRVEPMSMAKWDSFSR